jgi:hypothetical protein
MKFQTWSQEEAQKEIPLRLRAGIEHRSQFEAQWRANEDMLFSSNGTGEAGAVSVSFDNLSELFAGDMDSGDSWISTNYCFKYLRYIHSQMSANPPSVTPRPTSQDYKDRKAAEVADHLVSYGRRQYRIQDKIDLQSLQTLAYGTGFSRTQHDPNVGDILEVDRATKEITMTGDFTIRPKLIWDIVLDHTAREWEEVRYFFERHVMSVEEATFNWPEFKDKLEAYAAQKNRSTFWDKDEFGVANKNRVSVWEYVEKGLPWNGMAGRRIFLLSDGTLLSKLEANPHPNAELSLHILTDVDVPGQVYGKTFIDYLVRLQDVLNRLDSTVLDNIQAHGVVRMVVYDAAEGTDDQPANSGWQIMKLKGTAAQKPDFINPPQLMPDIYKFREQLIQGMDNIAGFNESMAGQVNREMSGFSIQTAINAGNTVRRRLFNKYQDCVESIFRSYLSNVKANWPDPRKILVVGEEQALSVAYYSGADIENGYDLDVQYGATFSLDPANRREEIMQIMPLLKEAGMSMKSILKMMRLNDVSGLFDMATVAARRQLEIIDEMIAKYEEDGVLVYIAPRELEEHEGMLTAAYEFRMSMAFKVLGRDLQALIERHIKDREAMAAAAAAPAGGPLGGPEGGAAMAGPGLPAPGAAPAGLGLPV